MRAQGRLGRRGLAVTVMLLILAGQTVLVAAAPHHQDFAKAAEDYAALVAMGERVRDIADGALVHILRDNTSAATTTSKLTTPLIDAMAQVVSYRGPVPSAAVLEPLSDAARDLSENTTRFTRDATINERLLSAAFPTYAGLVQARHVVDEMIATLDDLDINADAYEVQRIDVTALRTHIDALRAKLEKLREDLDAALVAIEDDTNPALFMFMSATPSTVALGETVEIAGAVYAGVRPVAGLDVGVTRDDGTVIALITNANGGFRFPYEVPVNASYLGVRRVTGAATERDHSATASAVFNVTRIPTRTSLVADRLTVVDTANVTLYARVDPVPPPARLLISIDGARFGEIFTGATGRADFAVAAAAFGYGCHGAIARFEGDAMHAPSASPESACAFSVSSAIAQEAPPTGSFYSGLIERAGDLAWYLILILVLILIVIGAVAGYVIKHVRAARREAERLANFVDYAGVPREIASAIERGIARIDPGPTGPLHAIVRAYATLLVRLARDGVDPRPLTPREIGRVMLARAFPEAPVHAATSLFELALYADIPLDDGAVSTFESTIEQLAGVST